MNATKWTVTSPTGQILYAELLPEGDPGAGEILLSSNAGNHGTVTQSVWAEKCKTMESIGYTITSK
jgi:hypothetical protein